MVNVVCSPGLWARDGGVGRNATSVLVGGVLETRHNVTNLVTDRLEQLDLARLDLVMVASASRDFR